MILPIRPYEPAMGNIYGNPFHEVALDVAKKAKIKFMVNAVQNPHKQNIAFVAGDLVEAHKKGVDVCRKASEIEITEKAYIVVSEYLIKSELEEMMLGWAPNLQQALDVALEKKVPNKILILPNAVNMIPKIIKGDINYEK